MNERDLDGRFPRSLSAGRAKRAKLARASLSVRETSAEKAARVERAEIAKLESEKRERASAIVAKFNNEFLASCNACGAERRALDGPAGPQRRQELVNVEIGRRLATSCDGTCGGDPRCEGESDVATRLTLCPDCLQALSLAIFPYRSGL